MHYNSTVVSPDVSWTLVLSIKEIGQDEWKVSSSESIYMLTYLLRKALISNSESSIEISI